MDDQDRGLLIDAISKISATSQKLDDFIEWTKIVHSSREDQIKTIEKTLETHEKYVTLAKVLTSANTLGILSTAFAWLKDSHFLRGG